MKAKPDFYMTISIHRYTLTVIIITVIIYIFTMYMSEINKSKNERKTESQSVMCTYYRKVPECARACCVPSALYIHTYICMYNIHMYTYMYNYVCTTYVCCVHQTSIRVLCTYVRAFMQLADVSCSRI